MTYEEIAEWARAGESERLEFKATTGQRRAAARTVCAMLNQDGGRVIFGIDDSGRIAGQEVGAGTLRDLQREFGEIQPPVSPSVSATERSSNPANRCPGTL